MLGPLKKIDILNGHSYVPGPITAQGHLGHSDISGPVPAQVHSDQVYHSMTLRPWTL